ncbi:NAD(P)H-dependent oxidoreductase [Candidatus Sororendozoicomonas aggregata]|uniref:NADPH-dependent FMN reductase n=1 Tax=Candidatus Sororendozoicomonas aggregata TaxID=3073239 RepID=UPI002ED69D81
MKIFAFAASSSKQSINKQLVTYASTFLAGVDIEIADLNDYDLPLFSEDKEKELGHPEKAQHFLDKIKSSDGLLISFAEHNGTYSVAYKNLFDWCSRINPKVFQNKPMVLLASSPGARGGSSVLKTAVDSAPYFSGSVVGSASVPRFYENFDANTLSIKDKNINAQVKQAVEGLLN